MFEFTEEYRTGIELIDKEHEHLFDIIAGADELIRNEFIPDKYDNIMALLNELTEYTKVHFADEEAYMEKIHYDGLGVQKAAHAGFVEKLEDIEQEGFEENQQQVLLDLLDFLFGWLVQHILKMDKNIPYEG